MALDSTGGRLSPENIADVLLRTELYREIRAAQEKELEKGWFTYEIQPSEILMPELIAYRAYSLDTLKWVILIAAGLDDPESDWRPAPCSRFPPRHGSGSASAIMPPWKRRGVENDGCQSTPRNSQGV